MRNKNKVVSYLHLFGTKATIVDCGFEKKGSIYLFQVSSERFGNFVPSYHVHNVIELGVQVAEWLYTKAECDPEYRDELKRSIPGLLCHLANDFKKLP